MERRGIRAFGIVAMLASVMALAGCELPSSPATSLPPQARRDGLAKPAPAAPSARSEELARYYRVIQNDLLAQGLLRTDGGGPDTPFSAEDLVDDFIAIAFFEEYSRKNGSTLRGEPGRLSRWSGPVRVGIEFGESVPASIRDKDSASIGSYVDRLARLTRHSVSVVRSNPNFFIVVAGEDDRTALQGRLKTLIPTISRSELDLFANLPRSYYCLVVGVAGGKSDYDYTRAVALIRAEHPDLVRLSCVHEEIAQGLGLPNDSPDARPSIFNDDDEFALLTNHDEMLLKILYDPRLTPGMTAEEARPIALVIARELMGQDA